MLKCLMAPLDGSATAEMVLPYVSEIAVKSGARIILARVCEPGEQRDECGRYLEAIAAIIRGESGTGATIEIVSEVLSGEPFEAITTFAGQQGCGLLVMASRGESNQPQWPIGTIAQKIIRASRIPILLIRRLPPQKTTVKGGLFRKILVPLDGSALAEAALEQAVQLATIPGRIMESSIVLLEVIERIAVPPGSQTSGARWQATNIEAIMKSLATRYLQEKAAALQDRVKDITIEVAIGSPAERIIEYAQVNDIDLIVMSSHGRSGIGRWYFGSVAGKVLNAGDVPLLIIRPANP